MIEQNSGVFVCVGSEGLARFFKNTNRGFGFVDSETPELSIAVKTAHRNKGIGRALLNIILNDLKLQGCKKISLSVDKNNRAVNLYSNFGFTVFKEQNTDYIMVKEFALLNLFNENSKLTKNTHY